jgi:Uma2 family endonuclease
MTISHSERYANTKSNTFDSLPLDLSTLKLTDEQFDRLCVANPEQPLELTAQGVLVIMSPVGGESGEREADLGGQLYVWNHSYKLGKVFSSSTIFKLPLGSQRSPDAAWVELSRWNALSLEQQQRFPPIAPDFLIELRSRTDILATLQAKMIEYRDNGVSMGLLINPQDKQVEIYRTNREIEVIQSPKSVDCNDILSGFVLDLANII